MTVINRETDTEDEFETEDQVPLVGPRLAEPVSVNKIMKECPEFSIATGEECDLEEDTDIMQVYSYEKLEPYILTENIDVDSDDEGDGVNPILPFSTYQRKMECVTEDGKVKKLLEKCGVGPTVKESDKCVVFVHYSMYNDYNEVPFDVSRLRQKKPVALRLGYDSMIPGMIIAIQTMKKGERSKFLVDPELGFGELGVPPRILPNATILLDIELIDFTSNEEVVARYGKDEDEVQTKRTFQETLHAAEKFRHHGSKLKELKKDLNGAIKCYRRAICMLTQFHYDNDQDENEGRKQLLKLYTNLCLSYNAKNSYRQACAAYNNALHDCPGMVEKHPKLLYHSAKALRSLGDFKEAVARLKKALRLKPDDEDILRLLDEVTKERVQHEKKEKGMYQKMFGFSKSESNEEDKKFEEMMKTVNKGFKDMVISQVESVLESDQDSVKFSFGATPAEKEYCEKVCKRYNLSFRVTKADGVETFILTKKA